MILRRQMDVSPRVYNFVFFLILICVLRLCYTLVYFDDKQ